jgi:DNA adenine methylase
VRFSVPHPIPYQGSKRRLAIAILSHVEDNHYKRLVEPFAGSAAVTLAAAKYGKAASFLIGDRLEPLVELWQRIIEEPKPIADQYQALWYRERERPIDEYYALSFSTLRKECSAVQSRRRIQPVA